MAKKTAKNLFAPDTFKVPDALNKDELIVEGLRQNNLKNITVRIPHNKITAVVGPSGSGKSSLAFDTLFAEGRWRFIESLSTYTRLFLERMDRPILDSISNIRPAIAVEQRNPVRTSRSTVGTATEVNDYLRLFFARVGRLHCPQCGADVKPSDAPSVADGILARYGGSPITLGFTVKRAGRAFKELSEDLLKKGFTRIRLGHEVYPLAAEPEGEVPAQKLPEETDVVADRLILKDSERARLSESIETSFREGGGLLWVELPDKRTERFSNLSYCAKCAKKVDRPTSVSLSFNHPVGACPECKGFGNVLRYDIDKVIPDKTLSLNSGAIEPWTKPAYTRWFEELKRYAPRYRINMDRPFNKLPAREVRLVFEGTADFDGIDGFFEYLETKKYKLHIKVFTGRYKGPFTCAACNGARLKKSALNVTVGGLNIAEASALTIGEAEEFFKTLELNPFEKEVSKEVLRQLTAKLSFLNQTGLGYITLDRLTKTLSGGESQRVTIATQLAATLTGVLYILDEPSIGLHPVDIGVLTGQLKKLSSAGNTVVVVEHDPSIIISSDHIVELGPGAGDRGGRLVYSGPTVDFLRYGATLTSDYLSGRQAIHTPRWRRKGSGQFLKLSGARGNNLKGIDIRIPLKTLTCVTGVSGSGKSTLVVDTLYRVLAGYFGERAERPLPYASFEGAVNINGIKLVDQSPVGRTPRSNPITYMGGFDDIRRLFAFLPSARAAGLAPSHFSFNVPGGRCETCKGEGVEKLEMYFLPDVYIKCAVCGGKRYKPGVLGVKYRGKNIYDCLEMTFDEASFIFSGEQALMERFSVIREIGLGYLKLGQSALTLSGGEAQRLKIAKELMEKGAGRDTLYIFDEPTTGLHMDDTKKLLSALGRLIDSGNTALIIEHNLDCIKTADYIIDLGPGGGDRGGTVVVAGAPETVARCKESLTGKYLKGLLS